MQAKMGEDCEKLADAVAAGARETGAAVDIKRVPETAPEAVANLHTADFHVIC
jgi:hypothetical protein